MQESPLHRIDLGEIGGDVVIAAALPEHEAEAAARECLRRTCAAEMNDRSQLLPLLTADLRIPTRAENGCDVAVQEHRRELGGVAWHDRTTWMMARNKTLEELCHAAATWIRADHATPQIHGRHRFSTERFTGSLVTPRWSKRDSKSRYRRRPGLSEHPAGCPTIR